MRVALCQTNPTVGALQANCGQILAMARRAVAAGARLAVFPELALCGYPPEDLLGLPAFLRAHEVALGELAAQWPEGLAGLVGVIEPSGLPAGAGGKALYNGAALVERGRAEVVARKCLLPTYSVFDERRWFAPWQEPARNAFTLDGERLGVAICEDVWNDAEYHRGHRLYPLDPVAELAATGIRNLCVLSASPWALGREHLRVAMGEQMARRHGIRMVHVNQVGAQVDLVFDGGSFAAGPDGLAAEPVRFTPDLSVVDLGGRWCHRLESTHPPECHARALTLGISDYAEKYGFTRAVLGVSGGIDSAVVAALAADALGPGNVTGIALPSRHSSDHSLADARALAANLGIGLMELPIAGMHDAAEATLRPVFQDSEPGTAEENLQSRIRGVLLMAHANKTGAMLLTTGNKSETAVGYATLYGDMCGALAPIADLWKTEVYALVRWLNRDRERIPEATIAKPPSAELRPDQKDTDSLPDYDRLDPVLRGLVEEERPVAEVAAATGMALGEVARLSRLVQANEFKRFQYAPTLRVSTRHWGARRFPVAHRFVDPGTP